MNEIVFEKQYTEPKKSYNIISVCVFAMKKGYKKSDTYINGLKYTVVNFQKYLPEFHLRIYYDKSIENDAKWSKVLKYAEKHKRVQLVKFHHPWFVDSDGYHSGTFGTIVRLFPLFSNNNEPHLKTILIGDVDFNEEMFPYWRNTYKLLKVSKSQVHMFARNCNHLNERVKRIVKLLDLPISPFLNSFWSKIRFPYELLDTFLKCMHDGQNINATIGCKEVDIFLTKTDYSKVKKANKMEVQKFMYGIDEICLLMMVKHIITTRIAFSYHTFPDLLIPFREAYTTNPALVNTPKHKQIIKLIMDKYYDDAKTTYENFTFMYLILNSYVNYLQPQKINTQMMAYFAKNIKTVYASLLDSKYKQLHLCKELLQCVTKNSFSNMTLVVPNLV